MRLEFGKQNDDSGVAEQSQPQHTAKSHVLICKINLNVWDKTEPGDIFRNKDRCSALHYKRCHKKTFAAENPYPQGLLSTKMCY